MQAFFNKESEIFEEDQACSFCFLKQEQA